jgi:general L-amino acid transport system substrate-binding protein
MTARFFCLALLCAIGAGAQAGAVLDRVKANGMVRCGAVERPGIAAVGENGAWQGLAVDVCRAVAAAVLGAPDKVSFDEYETPKQYDRVRFGKDDLYFLTGTEIRFNDLPGAVLPGPAIYYQSHRIMVPAASAARKIADLAGAKICVMIASPIERSVTDWFERRGLPWQPIPFSEDGEMVDAYRAGVCQAVAYELTTLAGLLADPGPGGQGNRILDDSVATFPIMAATGTRDAEWSAIVAWTVDTLIAGERIETPWYSGGAGAMPVAAPELGLDAKWQHRVLAAVGHYGSIFERNLGRESGLQLARGPNADPVNGGLLLAPFLE